jgi:hypothetical protein
MKHAALFSSIVQGGGKWRVTCLLRAAIHVKGTLSDAQPRQSLFGANCYHKGRTSIVVAVASPRNQRSTDVVRCLSSS